jgi:peptidoglycan hydrolase-like protein with peptidoglycan-binding domain
MKKVISIFSVITLPVMVFAFVFIGKTAETHAQYPYPSSSPSISFSIPSTLSTSNGGGCASYTWSTDLTLGSTGADVVALQTWLLLHGFDIPSISSGATAKGYFGSQTVTALAQFQTSIGLPAYGYFGLQTRTYLNTHQCGSGTTAINSLTLLSSPSNVSTTGGNSYDVAAYRIIAGTSNLSVSYADLDFNNRLWLYANKITIKDDSGAIIGTTLLGNSNFTEIAVGSDYRVSVPVRLIINSAQSKNFTVNISFSTSSDRTSTTLSLIKAQVHAVDSSGVNTVITSLGGSRSFVYNSNYSASSFITASLDSASPVSSVVNVSQVAQTQNIPLAIFDLKSNNLSSTLQGLVLGLQFTSSDSVAYPPSNYFNKFKIQVGGQIYYGVVTTRQNGAPYITFSNMSIQLPANQIVPIKVLTDVNAGVNGVTAQLNLFTSPSSASNLGVSSIINAVDTNQNSVAVQDVGDISSSITTFSSSDVQVSNAYTTLGTVVTNSNESQQSQTATYVFSLTAGNYPIFISNSTSSIMFSGNIYPSSINMFSVDGSMPGDGSNYFMLPPGATRQFSIVAAYNNSGLSSGGVYKSDIASINYGTSTSNLSVISLTTGLSNLSAVFQFNGGLSSTQPAISNTSSTLGTQVCGSGSTACTQSVNFSFTLTAGNDPMFISKAGIDTVCPVGYACVSAGPLVFNQKDGSVTPVIGSVVTNPSLLGGDSTDYFMIPPGATRTFTYSGSVSSSGVAQIVAIQYGTNSNNLTANSIISGLDNLRAVIMLSSGSVGGGGAGGGVCSSYTWYYDLTVGSNGADVSALQTWLIAHGFDIPSISSGATAKGYFGSQTVTALAQFQTSIGLPAYGYFGLQTRTYLNTHQCDVGVPTQPSATSVTTYQTPNAVFDIPVTSPPNTGATWGYNDNQTINWTYPSTLAGKTVKLGVLLVNSQMSSWLIDNETVTLPSETSRLSAGVPWSYLYQKNLGNLPPTLSNGSYFVQINAIDSSTGVIHSGNSGGLNVGDSSTLPQSSINVTYPTNGMTFVPGQSVSVVFNNPVYQADYTIALTEAVKGGGEYYILGHVKGQSADVQKNSFVIPSNVVSGPYAVQVMQTTSPTGQLCPSTGCGIGYSNGTFTIGNNSTLSQPPVISGGSFPTTLTVGQTGTWTVNASDPQNSSLSYSVDWGDNVPVCPAGYVCEMAATAKVFTQSTSFTHSYSKAGTYTIKFTVKNSSGLTATTNTNVYVADNTAVVCPAGYICTPYGQATVCPNGYTCSYASYSCPTGYTCYSYSKTPTPITYPTITYPTYSPSPTPSPAYSPSPTPAPVSYPTYSPSPSPTPTPSPNPVSTPSPSPTPSPVSPSPSPVSSSPSPSPSSSSPVPSSSPQAMNIDSSSQVATPVQATGWWSSLLKSLGLYH